jgi:hypothetical protein
MKRYQLECNVKHYSTFFNGKIDVVGSAKH